MHIFANQVLIEEKYKDNTQMLNEWEIWLRQQQNLSVVLSNKDEMLVQRMLAMYYENKNTISQTLAENTKLLLEGTKRAIESHGTL